MQSATALEWCSWEAPCCRGELVGFVRSASSCRVATCVRCLQESSSWITRKFVISNRFDRCVINHKRISFRDGEKNVRSSGITFWRYIIHRVPHSVISNSKFSILFPTCKWEFVTFVITWIFAWYNWIFEIKIDLNIETNTPSWMPSELFAHCPSLCYPCFGF